MRFAVALVFLANSAFAEVQQDCVTAADQIFSVWPEMAQMAGVKSGSALMDDPRQAWETSTFVVWRSAMEKMWGSQDLVWNSLILLADKVAQCAADVMPPPEDLPNPVPLRFYLDNRDMVLIATRLK